MFQIRGRDLYMRAGDHGVPLSFRLHECCDCGEELLPTDQIKFSVLQQGKELLARRWEVAALPDGVFSVEFTREESAKMGPGAYFWKLTLLRRDETENALTDGLLVVGLLAQWRCGPWPAR